MGNFSQIFFLKAHAHFLFLHLFSVFIINLNPKIDPLFSVIFQRLCILVQIKPIYHIFFTLFKLFKGCNSRPHSCTSAEVEPCMANLSLGASTSVANQTPTIQVTTRTKDSRFVTFYTLFLKSFCKPFPIFGIYDKTFIKIMYHKISFCYF